MACLFSTIDFPAGRRGPDLVLLVGKENLAEIEDFIEMSSSNVEKDTDTGNILLMSFLPARRFLLRDLSLF